MHILLRCARTTLVTCMRNTAMSETCTAVSRLLQEGVVFNVYSGMIIGVNMPFGIKIGLGPDTGGEGVNAKVRAGAVDLAPGLLFLQHSVARRDPRAGATLGATSDGSATAGASSEIGGAEDAKKALARQPPPWATATRGRRAGCRS